MPKRNLIWIVAIFAAVMVGMLIRRGPSSPLGTYHIVHQPVSLVAQAIEDECLWSVANVEVQSAGIEAMIRRVDHGWTRWVPAQGARRLSEHLKGQAFGTGMTLSHDGTVCTVTHVVYDGPAWNAGLRVGDRITQIDGRPITDAALPEGLLDGALEEPVTLTLAEPPASMDGAEVALKPDKYDIESVKGVFRNAAGEWHCFLDAHEAFAYLRITEFTARTDRELAHAFREIEDAEGLILDLRGNPGGPLDEAIILANRFLKEGPIVYVASRDKVQTHSAGWRRTFWPDRPVVILVNHDTVSAAELLAGALQHVGRAELVGQPTEGKRFIQTVFPIDEAGDLVLTTGYYDFKPIPVDFQGKPIVAYQGLVPLVPDAFVAQDSAQWTAIGEAWNAGDVPMATDRKDAMDARVTSALDQDPQLQVALARLMEQCRDE